MRCLGVRLCPLELLLRNLANLHVSCSHRIWCVNVRRGPGWSALVCGARAAKPCGLLPKLVKHLLCHFWLALHDLCLLCVTCALVRAIDFPMRLSRQAHLDGQALADGTREPRNHTRPRMTSFSRPNSRNTFADYPRKFLGPATWTMSQAGALVVVHESASLNAEPYT